MPVDGILQTISAVKMAFERYRAACGALWQEISIAFPSGSSIFAATTLAIHKKTILVFSQLLFHECRSSIAFFDLTTEAAMELSWVIRSRLFGQQLQREPFVASYIPRASEGGATRAMKTTSERCQIALIALQQDLASLSSTGLPSDAVYQSHIKNLEIHGSAILLKCQTLMFLFDFMSEFYSNAVVVSRSRREQQLEREGQHLMATKEPAGTADANVAMSGIDLNFPVTEVLYPRSAAMSSIDLNLPAPEETVQNDTAAAHMSSADLDPYRTA